MRTQCKWAKGNLTLSLGRQLGIIDLGVTEALACVGGSVELGFAMAYDVQSLTFCFGAENGEQLLFLGW